MGLPEMAAKWFARGWVGGARKGKRGEGMKKLFSAIDGKKRSIVLLAFIVVAWLKALGVGDFSEQLSFLLQLVDWNADGLLGVPLSLIAGTVSGVVAIVHAAVKSWKADAEEQSRVTLPR
jgi:Na+/proline symporter